MSDLPFDPMPRWTAEDFHSRPEHAVESEPRVRLPSGKVVTPIPLADKTATLDDGRLYRARLGRDEMEEALERLGLVFLSLATVHEINRVGLWIKAKQLVRTAADSAQMRSIKFAKIHDEACWTQIDAAGGLQGRACMNFMKWQTKPEPSAGPPPGPIWNCMAGWSDVPGGPLRQAGTGYNHVGYYQIDYGTGCMGEEPQ